MPGKKKSYSTGIAARIFRLRAQGANIPNTVFSAAKAMKRGNATPFAHELVRQYLHIDRRGGGKIAAYNRRVTRYANQAASVGLLVDTVERGGRGSALAAYSLGQQASELFQNALASRPVKDMSEKLGAWYYGKQAGPIIAAQMGYKAIAYARLGSAIVSSGAIAAYGLEKVARAAETSRTGMDLELHRQLQADARERAAPNRITGEQRSIQKVREQRMREENRRPLSVYLSKAIGDVGTESTEMFRSAAENARLNIKGVTPASARRRAKYEYQYWNFSNDMRNSLRSNSVTDTATDWWYKKDYAKLLDDKVERYTGMRESLKSLSDQGRFKEATKMSILMHKEFSDAKWLVPQRIYAAEESARVSTRLWAQQRTPRSASRIGD